MVSNEPGPFVPRSGRNYARRTTATCAGRSEWKAAWTNETQRKGKEREDGGSRKERRGKKDPRKEWKEHHGVGGNSDRGRLFFDPRPRAMGKKATVT